MNWFSLIPTALSALGGIFGGNNTTKTTSNTDLSPAMKAATGAMMGKANEIWKTPYSAYSGERVAGPDAATRPQLDAMMGSLGNQVNAGMNDANGYQARIRDLMARGPNRVTAPTMVPGGPQATMTQQPTGMPVMPTPPTGV